MQFENFQQMKYALAKSEPENEAKKDIADIIFGYYENIIKSTKQFITKEQISHIVSIMSKANNIVFCGMGSSGIIAEEFNSRTERMGINSSSITDSHAMLIKTTLMGNKDVLFCFSYTGKTQSVIDSARIAKDNGAKVVVITNYDETELTKIADEVVLVSSHIYMDDEKFVNTQIASLFVLDILTYSLLENDKRMENRKKHLIRLISMDEAGQRGQDSAG
ncbi:MurR/RpiR family transcriptional regulator [Virgibacillus sp. 179-BFC.A HS]|uniref:MurR/RpiR family transcriptional regulator n=1 Tax=Tigheibacillus jepli TaxID=3035914 RepID=A0ABU5CJQ7_9BACI|nr:MurR/RpiR family transcriptional regulator [Virgibacillus sp. 179-BFC.A HS]MDY0406546.1 MurR/RpiR family transcriptional regulator [Virgibacillus sp. 179-BFC.A HS]